MTNIENIQCRRHSVSKRNFFWLKENAFCVKSLFIINHNFYVRTHITKNTFVDIIGIIKRTDLLCCRCSMPLHSIILILNVIWIHDVFLPCSMLLLLHHLLLSLFIENLFKKKKFYNNFRLFVCCHQNYFPNSLMPHNSSFIISSFCKK